MAKAKVAAKKKVEDPAPRVSIRVSIRHRIRAIGRSVRRGLAWWRPILLTTCSLPRSGSVPAISTSSTVRTCRPTRPPDTRSSSGQRRRGGAAVVLTRDARA